MTIPDDGVTWTVEEVRDFAIRLLEKRVGPLPTRTRAKLEAINSREMVLALVEVALTIKSLDDPWLLS